MLKNLAKRVVPAASQLPQDDLNAVVEGLRAKNLLNLRRAHKGAALLAAPVVAAAAPPPCSRQVLGDELYEKLHCVCARSDFFGSFGRDILEKILNCATVHLLKEQNLIFAQQDVAASMFVVLDGAVALFQELACEDKKAQSTLTAGKQTDKKHSETHELDRAEPTSADADAFKGQIALQSHKGSQELPRSVNATLSMIDWKCEFKMNRWKRYFCVLMDGKFTWSESKAASVPLGGFLLSDVTACAIIEKDTVGFTRFATVLDENELEELVKGHAFAVECRSSIGPDHDLQIFLFETKSKKATEMWVEEIRAHMRSTSHAQHFTYAQHINAHLRGANTLDSSLSPNHKAKTEKLTKKEKMMRTQRRTEKGQGWVAKSLESGKTAWAEVCKIFGDPVRYLLAGEAFGEITSTLDHLRAYTALALDSCVLVELHMEQLLEMQLLDVVIPGSMWTLLHRELRPEPMERMNREIDYVLSAVNYMPFFYQLPLTVRRSFLELCKSHVFTGEASAVLGHYVGPFRSTSSVPIFIVLQGKLEIYQGHTLLKEGIQALGKVPFEEIKNLFPRKVQKVLAEEAWGGPHLIQEECNQELCRLQKEVVKEVNEKKVRALRNLISEKIGASSYTVIAAEGTSYLTIEQRDWSSLFPKIRDVVFRIFTLYQILQKPPRERTPQEARLAACLLHGYAFFQQLPFRIILDLAYSVTFVTVETGIVLAKEGVACDRVFLFLAGTATVHKSQGKHHLRLPIGPGKTVTLEDARVFFGPVSSLIHEGDYFGVDILTPGSLTSPSVATHSLVASSRCHILQISASDYRSKVERFTNSCTPIPDSIFNIIQTPANLRTADQSHALAQSMVKVGVLSRCPEGLLNELIQHITFASVDRGAVLAAEGEETQIFSIIVGGSASVHTHSQHDPLMEHHSSLSWLPPMELSMRWGLCKDVIQVGGSFGEVAFAAALPQWSTVIARETCQLLSLNAANIPALLLGDLKGFISTSHGVPSGLEKPQELRSEYDVVQGMGFLSNFEYFKDYPPSIMLKISKIAEFLSFDKGATIQRDYIRGTFLHVVHGGRIEVLPEDDASNIFFAAMGLGRTKAGARRDKSQKAKHSMPAFISVGAASACLQKLASNTLENSEVGKEVETAMRKSVEDLSPERRTRTSIKKLLDLRGMSSDVSEARASKNVVNVIEYGKHFILGHAKAIERSQLIRIDWTKCKQIVEDGLEEQLRSTVLFLSHLKPFETWKNKDLYALAESTKIIKLPRKAHVVSKGQVLETLYVVKAGSCFLQGSLALQGAHGFDMVADDKLYRTSQPHAAAGAEEYTTSLTNRKLFRCPNCSTQPHRTHLHRRNGIAGRKPHSPQLPLYAMVQASPVKKVCGICHGTGSVQASALSTKSAATSLHSEVSLGVITVGSIVNAALDKTKKPLEHSIVADHGCELYSIEIKHLLDVCRGHESMLQGLKKDCSLIEDWHSRREDSANGAHTKLHDQVDHLLHPRPKDDFGGEKPNPEMYKKFQPAPQKTYSKALGSSSISKSGAHIGLSLHTPLPSRPISGETGTTLENSSSLQKSKARKMAQALGIHNMELVKAKHAAAALVADTACAAELAADSERRRTDGDGFLLRVEEHEDGSHGREEEKQEKQKVFRRIEPFDGRSLTLDISDDDETRRKSQSAKTDRAIQFWDETGKHETMPAHLDADLLELPVASLPVKDEEEEEAERLEKVYTEALGSLLGLHSDLCRSVSRSRSKSKLGAPRSKIKHNGRNSTGGGGWGEGGGGVARRPTERSFSTLPSLHNLDAMQHVYSDIKSLHHKCQYVDDPQAVNSRRMPELSGWQAMNIDDIGSDLSACKGSGLPLINSTSSEKVPGTKRSNRKEHLPSNGETRSGTPTISTQLFDFAKSDDKGSADTTLKKLKREKPKRFINSTPERYKRDSKGTDGEKEKKNAFTVLRSSRENQFQLSLDFSENERVAQDSRSTDSLSLPPSLPVVTRPLSRSMRPSSAGSHSSNASGGLGSWHQNTLDILTPGVPVCEPKES